MLEFALLAIQHMQRIGAQLHAVAAIGACGLLEFEREAAGSRSRLRC
jgi:hypothetical protein